MGRQQILQQYEQILSHWPSPNMFHQIDTEFGKTFVIESGNRNGRPLVLLHGSASNTAMWLGDAMLLGQTHHIYAVDIIGEPGKSSELRPSLKKGVYARWLQAVLDALSIKSTAVAGNSLGGWIALDFATYAPERACSLVLLASSGLYPVRKSFALKMLTSKWSGSKDRLGKTMTGSAEIPEAVAAYFALIRREFFPRPMKAPVFSDREIRRLGMPVLYIGGEEDTLLNTQRSAARLKRLIPNADVRKLPGIGHAVIGQAGAISAFLTTQEE
jgi:pimeloyl-ACP methyl ester carboxylesterase